MSTLCQHCFARTERRCGDCGICVYCSEECEANADAQSNARVACALHKRLEREPSNLGECAAHIRMVPKYATNLTRTSEVTQLWDGMCTGTMHFLRLLIGTTPTRVYKKSAFGIGCTLTPDFDATGGVHRFRFEMGSKLDASKKVVKTMATLVQTGTRAVIAVGCVANDAKLHFDALFVSYCDGLWTVQCIKPLWEQKLTKVDDHSFEMNYKLEGGKPKNTQHRLAEMEQALNPPRAESETHAAPVPQAWHHQLQTALQ